MSITDEIISALPSYEIGGEIGRGSWGVVLKGHHRQLARDVAIKQLPLEFAADPDVRRRFVNEARLLASLDHPHIVPIYDYIERDTLCLLVMEYLPGGTVWSHFTTTGITMETSCSLTMATCAGLQYAHERGVLHRDIKPENLMFSGSDTLKVTDFGIAKMVSGTHTMATRAGEVLGSPAYIAPEQATGGELGPATDVYATAVMLYELLSGRLPFPEDGDPLMVLYRHVHEPPTPILEIAPNVPPQVAGVVMRGLATQVSERYQTAEQFGVAIAEAGSAVWGPGWLGRAAITLMGGGPIQAAAERPSQPPAAYVSPGYAPPPPAVAPQVPGQFAPGASGITNPSPVAPIQPATAQRASYGASLAALTPGDLVAVEEVQGGVSSSPRIPALVAVGLALLTIVIAFLGVSRAKVPPAPPGLTIQGQAVRAGEPIVLDLNRPIEVTTGRPGLPGPNDGPGPGQPAQPQTPASGQIVTISFSVAGVPLGSAEGKVADIDNRTSAQIDAHSLKYFLAGETRGEITFKGAQNQQPAIFTAKSKQNPLLTVPGLATIALLLFAAAYMEATMRSMRRGRRKTGGVIELAFLGAIVGATLLLLSWLVQAKSPTIVGLGLCAMLGAASGAALGAATGRIGSRRRLSLNS
ncbi:MAG: serine/threonine protein kinase [Acidobacteria bacterium]|nr:MAG: serine/threonine protein kinase [Acidobacteriota bacterium]